MGKSSDSAPLLYSKTYHVSSESSPQNEYAIKVNQELGFEWNDGEERVSYFICFDVRRVIHKKFQIFQHTMNSFKNDTAYISIQWLLRLVSNWGLQVQHLLRVTRIGTSVVHYVAILPDCCMGLNLGIPCRHYFQVLLKMPNLLFHIGLICSW